MDRENAMNLYKRAAGRDSHMTKILGFDPVKLLDDIEFPFDRFEVLLRRYAQFRKLAIRRAPLSQYDASKLGDIKKQDIPKQTFDHLARTAASLVIQAFWRSKIVQRNFGELMYRLFSQKAFSAGTPRYMVDHRNCPAIRSAKLQDKVLKDYAVYSSVTDFRGRMTPEFPHYCATKIQSVYRMFVIRRRYLNVKMLPAKVRRTAFIQLAEEWSSKIKSDIGLVIRENASRIIQNFWRKLFYKKVYHFYLKLLDFFNTAKSSPHALLKLINPKESQLIDKASGVHIRFRLGGDTFPPSIYYKIYVHQPLVDMNSFSPRVYWHTREKIPLPCQLHIKGEWTPSYHDGWYDREENNGWRAVSLSHPDLFMDPVSAYTSRTVPFHHCKFKRREDLERQKKIKKLEWFRKVYKEGKKEEGEFIPEEPTIEDEIDALIEWTSSLDYEEYHHHWLQLATAGLAQDSFYSIYASNMIGKINNQAMNQPQDHQGLETMHISHLNDGKIQLKEMTAISTAEWSITHQKAGETLELHDLFLAPPHQQEQNA